MLKDKRYQVYTDQNDVQWRIDRKNPDAKMVKLNDPNFVQGRVALPTIKVGRNNIDALGVVGYGLLGVIALLIAGLIGSAV